MALSSWSGSLAARISKISSASPSSVPRINERQHFARLLVKSTLFRFYSSAAEVDLKSTLNEVIPAKRELLRKIKTNYADRSLGQVRVANALGGMR